jgi:CPA2 family monovalent cation:H+ antiporter-2
MREFDLILTLTGSLAAALCCGYVTLRLGLSPIVGYLLAGLVVGPYTPGFVANKHLADQLGEIGVILLMFGVGLQFRVQELIAVRHVAVPGAIGRCVVSTALGALLGVAYGWGWSAGLVFGMALSIASTVVLLRVLSDSGDLQTRAGHIAVGWLVVEDLLTVLVLVLLPSVFAAGSGLGGAAIGTILVLVKISVMVALTFFLGDRLIPWLLEKAAQTRSRELFTLTVLVVALGIAAGSVMLFGVSMALGAFLAGMVVGRTEFSLRAATDALPMRDAFAVLFFVSVGILFHPRILLESPGLVAATVAIVMLGKPLAGFAIVVSLRYPIRTALLVALATAQIGEFSFMLATIGERLGILDERARDALIAAAIISISVNPLIYRLVGPLESALQGLMKKRSPAAIPTGIGTTEEGSPANGSGLHYRAVIVGYGPVGRTLARLLRDNQIEPVIVELNVDTVRHLTSEGVAAIYGDATHRQTLESAAIRNATALILSSSTMQGTAETIRLARELNPGVLIFARSTYLRDGDALRRAGADLVFSGEGEIALAMMECMLRQLGATPDQIDRERERIRRELTRDAQSWHSVSEGRSLAGAKDEAAPGDRGTFMP